MNVTFKLDNNKKRNKYAVIGLTELQANEVISKLHNNIDVMFIRTNTTSKMNDFLQMNYEQFNKEF